MIRFWSAEKADETAIPLTLPPRLSGAETVRHLGDAFDIMTAVLIDGAKIADVAPSIGYRAVRSECLTPSLDAESFAHIRDEHRLILNRHRYPNYLRRTLNFTIPGGMTLEAFERFRLGRDCAGSTYHWRAHIYGEWRTAQESGSPGDTDVHGLPVFIELRQDVFLGDPLLLRVVFHQVMACD